MAAKLHNATDRTRDNRRTGLSQWLPWNRIIDALYAAGYDGDVAVEHEDPVWGGTLDKTLHGMQIAAYALRPLIVAERDAQPPPSASPTDSPYNP
jgi:sugar phosphate isomerase/epimerase